MSLDDGLQGLTAGMETDPSVVGPRAAFPAPALAFSWNAVRRLRTIPPPNDTWRGDHRAPNHGTAKRGTPADAEHDRDTP